MKIQFGMEVKTYEGDKIGTVAEIIVNPINETVTDIMVQKGLLFKTDRIIPVGSIMTTTESGVQLKPSTDLADFPVFNADYFVHGLDDKVMASNSAGMTPDGSPINAPLLYYPPISNLRRRPLNPIDSVTDDYGTPPEPTTNLQVHADVVTVDGEKAGEVEAIFTDDLGQITHLLVSEGIIFKEEKVLPVSWVEVIDPNTVRLQVKTRLVDALPQFHA